MIALSVRNGRLVTLIGWAGFLVWLQLDDQVPRYLGPRTAWIVPVGAVALGLSAVAYLLWSAGSASARRPLRLAEALSLAAVLAPVVVALCFADATLGSLAASNKLGNRGIDVARLADSLRKHSGKIDFLVIRGADEDRAMARQRGIEPGKAVELTGFVYKPAVSAAAPVRLARFYITCCVADSVAIDVPVFGIAGAASYPKDAWLTVTGILERRGGHLAVTDARATRVSAPKHPYLVFSV